MSLFCRFENEFAVNGVGLEWRVRERDFFFRPQGAPVEMIWCCLGLQDYGHKLLTPQSARWTQDKVARQMRLGFAWRYWLLSDSEELFFRSRFGIVRFCNVWEMFRFELPHQLHTSSRLETPGEEMREIVAVSQEDIERIRAASQCGPEERGWANVEWPWGTHDELRQLIRAMGDIIRRPEHRSFRWRYPLKTDFAGSILLATPYLTTCIPNPSLYEPFLRYLRTHFPVESDQLVCYDQRGMEHERVWPTITLCWETPSEHERMEAVLVWRDFLRDKVPSDEVREMLKL